MLLLRKLCGTIFLEMEVEIMEKYERIASVASRLQEAMDIACKSQADLVRETGISKGTLSRYLSGKFEPKQIAVNKLAIALNVAEMWLWGCDVPMERPAPEEIGSLAADVALNPKLSRAAQLFKELEEADQDMILMLMENLHRKQKKADTF
jgi:transcriptional regulator with XRE-family HTH domain